jgi:hypothetical protein
MTEKGEDRRGIRNRGNEGGLCTIVSFKENSILCQGLKIGIPKSRVIILSIVRMNYSVGEEEDDGIPCFRVL